MRLTLHWRGRPLVAVDIAAQSPDDETNQGPVLQAAASLQDLTRAEPAEPDTTVFGFGTRPVSAARNRWRAPRDGGYHPTDSLPEPTQPPRGPAGTRSAR